MHKEKRIIEFKDIEDRVFSSDIKDVELIAYKTNKVYYVKTKSSNIQINEITYSQIKKIMDEENEKHKQ